MAEDKTVRNIDPGRSAPHSPAPKAADPRSLDQGRDNSGEELRGGAAPEEPGPADPKTVDRVREILAVLANTVSAMKIFPAEHAGVRTFVDDFARKLLAFLDAHGRLEIDIREHAFRFADKPVYRDEQAIKSLPFFFHKDGMQSLAFYQGAEREEIDEWLELIRRESQRPADESDIVNAMWERDFPNIQYTAPDEFIENRILEERNESLARSGLTVLPPEFAARAVDVEVDRNALSRGRIDLSPADLESIRAARESPTADGLRVAPASASADPSDPAASAAEAGAGLEADAFLESIEPDAGSFLSAAEAAEIDSLVLSNRATPPETEFLDLLVEILFLEGDTERFRASLDSLSGFHLEQLRKGRFRASVLMDAKIAALRDHLRDTAPEKSELLEDFRKTIAGEMSLALVKDGCLQSGDPDPEGLAAYLRLAGSRALPVAADLFETLTDAPARAALLEFLAEAGARDPGGLVGAADGRRPRVSREIIRIVAALPDPKAVQHLAKFLSLGDKDLKIETIHVLGTLGGGMADKILAGFLADRNKEVRIQAALRLGRLTDRTRILAVIAEAGQKDFRDRGDAEKTAVFGFLGRTRAPEAFDFLSAVLRRRSFRRGAPAERLRLCAVHGLESLGTDEAAAVLRKFSASRNPRLREACERALRKIESGRGMGGSAR